MEPLFPVVCRQLRRIQTVGSTRRTRAFCAAFLTGAAPLSAFAQWIPLSNATASFTQYYNLATDLWNPSRTIDGITDGFHTSWAINHDPPATDVVIVWTTETNLDLPERTPLRFDLFHHDFIPSGGHTLGRFRLSYTTDDRSVFADGLAEGGDVEAHWTVIPPAEVVSTSFEEFFILPDQSVLVGGFLEDYPVYTVFASIEAMGITGFRLEALTDDSLPFGGPGRQPVNGNFHLSEFVVSQVGIQDRSVELSRELAFTVYPSDFGLPYETLTFELGPDAPEGASLSPDGYFSWTPGPSQEPGDHTITIMARLDGSSGVPSERTLVVHVLEPGNHPMLEVFSDDDTGVTLRWTPSDGKSYRIMTKGLLSDPIWIPLSGPITSGRYLLENLEPGQGFFRLELAE